MKPLLYREVKRKLETAGFVEVGQKGSHTKFAKATDAGVLTAIVRITKWSPPARCAALFGRLG